MVPVSTSKHCTAQYLTQQHINITIPPTCCSSYWCDVMCCDVSQSQLSHTARPGAPIRITVEPLRPVLLLRNLIMSSLYYITANKAIQVAQLSSGLAPLFQPAAMEPQLVRCLIIFTTLIFCQQSLQRNYTSMEWRGVGVGLIAPL